MSRDLELEKQIDAYIKGKLSEEQALELWEELLKRPDYIELLETELGLKSIYEQQAQAGTSTKTDSAEEQDVIYSIQKYWKWMAAAAVVIILVVSVNVLQFSTNNSLKNLAVQKFNLTENLASARILRSQSSSLSPGDSLLNRGFEAAVSGDLAKALQAYEKIIKDHADEPVAVKAYLNKGLILYNRKEFAQSAISFNHVIEKVNEKNPILKEKAYWYLGNAYINTNHLKEARNAIRQVYDMDGIYRGSAERTIKKLDSKIDSTNSDHGDG